MAVGKNWSQRPKYENQVVRTGHIERPRERGKRELFNLGTCPAVDMPH